MPSIYSIMMPLGSIRPKRTGYLFRRNQHHHFYRRSVQLFEKLMGCGPEFFERRHSIYLGRCSPPMRNTRDCGQTTILSSPIISLPHYWHLPGPAVETKDELGSTDIVENRTSNCPTVQAYTHAKWGMRFGPGMSFAPLWKSTQ
ncbi:hypothetical protein D3C76_855060 [compost metagenome]